MGVSHEIVAALLPATIEAVALWIVGEPGAVYGVTDVLVVAPVPVPAALIALTVNVYAVP